MAGERRKSRKGETKRSRIFDFNFLHFSEGEIFLADVHLCEKIADIKDTSHMVLQFDSHNSYFCVKILCHNKMLFIDYTDFTDSEYRPILCFRISLV